MVETGLPESTNGYKRVENEEQGLTFFVENDLAREIDGYHVEVSSIGVVFPRYYISSVRELES